jgi:hypothetical protein
VPCRARGQLTNNQTNNAPKQCILFSLIFESPEPIVISEQTILYAALSPTMANQGGQLPNDLQQLLQQSGMAGGNLVA